MIKQLASSCIIVFCPIFFLLFFIFCCIYDLIFLIFIRDTYDFLPPQDIYLYINRFIYIFCMHFVLLPEKERRNNKEKAKSPQARNVAI